MEPIFSTLRDILNYTVTAVDRKGCPPGNCCWGWRSKVPTISNNFFTANRLLFHIKCGGTQSTEDKTYCTDTWKCWKQLRGSSQKFFL